jgi:hypothetical protein
MLRIQIIGLALVSALFMSAVAVGSASAADHLWLINGALISSPVTVHSLGLLLLIDHNPIGGETVVHCHGYDQGTVGPHGLDLIEKITLLLLAGGDLIHCNVVKRGGCEASPTIVLALALNLPWLTHLYLEGSELRDRILGDGNGRPGWHVNCKTPVGVVTDVCISEEGANESSTSVTNITGGGVRAEFEKGKSGTAECFVEGVFGETHRKGAGLVEGQVLIESPSAGEKLSVD